MSPSLSIVVPVYNKINFLRRCLDSLVNQTDNTAQVIIIDDGSTDGSDKICDEYKQYGFEVYHTKNYGQGRARNKGIERASGDWIAFLDADDAYEPNAVEIMRAIAKKDVSNIVQFGHMDYPVGKDPIEEPTTKGFYSTLQLPDHWAKPVNKMYKTSFLEENKLRFPTDLKFGEDAIFNLQSIFQNKGIYCAPQTLYKHYLDDKESICRGQITLNVLEKFCKKMDKLEKQAKTTIEKDLFHLAKDKYTHSNLFKKNGYSSNGGSYDIVYFVKEASTNEELKYSLRSVERNFPYRNVCFYGGCPQDLKPDKHFRVQQTAKTKWERVRNMLREACLNDEITEDFWLFNDDFFILTPQSEDIPQHYNGDIYRHIVNIESRHGNKQTEYTKRLRHLCKTLEKAGLPTLNYAVHKPILMNRKKLLEVLDKFPDEPMTRALYGNYWRLDGVDNRDNKVVLLRYPIEKIKNWDFLSTDDRSFRVGTVGKYLKETFSTPSRFETASATTQHKSRYQTGRVRYRRFNGGH